VAVRALASQRAGLANEAAAAEAQAAVAQRRIPELENDKKAAAAARVSCITLQPPCKAHFHNFHPLVSRDDFKLGLEVSY
jgi:hypothetical protein